MYALLNSSSSAVKYEAAGTLITLSSAPSAVKAAASCYIDLIIKESDNNVKLIVLMNCKTVGYQQLRTFLLIVTKVLFLVKFDLGLKFTIQNICFMTNNEDICIVFQCTENLDKIVNTICIKGGIKRFVQDQ